MNKNSEEAFNYIIYVLRKNKLEFRVTGGLAANIYGSKRELVDIDIEVKNKDINLIFKQVKKYVIFGPGNYKDREFNLLLLTLNYKGQKIDISGIYNYYLFNKKTKKWQKERINLSNSVKMKVYDKIVPVIYKKDLIKYKNKIRRKVDIIDIENLTVQSIY